MLKNHKGVPVDLFGRCATPSGFMRAMSVAARNVVGWLETRGQRRALSALDDDRLRDIGLSREEVNRACRRPSGRADPSRTGG